MHKFTKELIECFEDKMDYDDYDEDYRDEEPREIDRNSVYRRYRRGM